MLISIMVPFFFFLVHKAFGISVYQMKTSDIIMNCIVNLLKMFNIKDKIIYLYSNNINRNFGDLNVIMTTIFFSKLKP